MIGSFSRFYCNNKPLLNEVFYYSKRKRIDLLFHRFCFKLNFLSPYSRIPIYGVIIVKKKRKNYHTDRQKFNQRKERCEQKWKKNP